MLNVLSLIYVSPVKTDTEIEIKPTFLPSMNLLSFDQEDTLKRKVAQLKSQ